MTINDVLIESIRKQLPNWKFTYDEDTEKYILTTDWNGMSLNSEEIEWFKKSGLEIFSIYKTDEFLSINFISGGYH